MKPNPVEVGARIRVIRLESGLTMDELAYKLNGSGGGLINNWEKGLSLPNANRLKRIASMAGITVDELLYGKRVAKYDLSNFTTNQLLDEIKRRLNA